MESKILGSEFFDLIKSLFRPCFETSSLNIHKFYEIMTRYPYLVLFDLKLGMGTKSKMEITSMDLIYC